LGDLRTPSLPPGRSPVHQERTSFPVFLADASRFFASCTVMCSFSGSDSSLARFCASAVILPRRRL
jgi:hypothetical protein